jgi:hypothetical protein
MYFLCCSIYFCVVLCIFCVVIRIVCFVPFSVLFVCICVLYYCHRVATHLQLTKILYHVIRNEAFNFLIPLSIRNNVGNNEKIL